MARQSRQPALPPFLLTRPAAQGDRFADLLRARFGGGIRVVHSPLLAPRFLSPALPAGWRSLIFTSETAVTAFRQLSAEPGLPAWCVGDRTAQAARAAGLNARSASGDLGDLVAAIRASGDPGPFLYARGQDVAGALGDELKRLNISVAEVIVYHQLPQPLSASAAALLAGHDPILVPVFSPRTARLLADDPAMQARRAPLWLAALSPAVALAADPIHAELKATAARPDGAAMLDALDALIATAPQP
jgi:uroporphyrinogen-III synthase